MMKRSKRALIALALTVMLIVSNYGTYMSFADLSEPTHDLATVDGDPSEWNLAKDFFANMWRGGHPPGKHLGSVLESKLYLRYDCSENTLYALVLGVEGVPVLIEAEDAYVKVDESELVDGTAGDDGTPPDFEWVERGFDQDDYHARGWEASAPLAPGFYELNVHTLVWDDGESQTSAVSDHAIELEIACQVQETGTIIVEKQTDPDGTPDLFTFDGDAAGIISDGQQIVVSDLPSGIYTSTETLLNGWNLTSIECDDDNSSGDTDSGMATFQLEDGETVKCTFTNTAISSLGDYVWEDLNADGIQDAGELGIPDVTVKLYECEDDENPVATTITDDSGSYGFEGLTSGDYYVQFMLPDGYAFSYAFSSQDQGDNDTLDSDADTTGRTGCTVLEPGENDPTWDAGLYQPTGTIIVEKQTDPDRVTTLFTFDGDAAGTISDGGQIVVSGLLPGTYTSQEMVVLEGWYLTDIECDDDNSSGDPGTATATFNLEAGETVKCTFHNKRHAAVDLVSFTAQVGAARVTVIWETATELDNAGFNLYRATSTDGSYTKVNDALITAQGDAVGGASYSFVDAPGYGTFYYKLEDVDYYGASTLHGPVEAMVVRLFLRPLYRPLLPWL